MQEFRSLAKDWFRPDISVTSTLTPTPVSNETWFLVPDLYLFAISGAVSGDTFVISAVEAQPHQDGVVTTTMISAISFGGAPEIAVGNGQNYKIDSSSVVGLHPITYAGISIAANGALSVDPALDNADRQILIVTAPGLSIAGSAGNWTGLLDLTNNDMDLPGGDLATTTDQIRQGYNLAGGGKWNGTGGITSSAAAADSSHLTALGVIQNNQGSSPIYTATNPFDGTTPGASDILVKYTYFGDANLDGKVDGSDYTLIDNGYNKGMTGWYNGDFNYDGRVDGSDYTLIDNAFNTQGGNLSSSALLAESTNQIAGTSSIPEPTAISVLAFATVGLLRRGRRADEPRQ